MKLKILYGLISLTMLCAFVACSESDDPEGGKISVPKDQPTTISVSGDDTEGQITLYCDFDINVWVSDVKGGAPASDIDWITVNQPYKEEGKWIIDYDLQTNMSGNSRTAYIVVVADDEKRSFTIKQSYEGDYDIPVSIAEAMVQIKCEAFEAAHDNSGSYLSDGVSYFELRFNVRRPSHMVHIWTDEMANGPGQTGDTECENRQYTIFSYDTNSIHAEITNNQTYLPSGREESMLISGHTMEFSGIESLARRGTYQWSDETGIAMWEPVYSSGNYQIQQMKHTDTDGEESHYIFTWQDDLLMKIEEEGTGNTVTFSYADTSLLNQYRGFDLNWVLPTELETLDFAAGDVTKIWASFGYLGMSSYLYATEISEYRKNENVTYTYRMNYETHHSETLRVTAAHLVNGVQDSYKTWEFNFRNMH